MTYAQRVIEQVKAKDPNQPEFIQAVTEVLASLEPVLAAHRRPEDPDVAQAVRQSPLTDLVGVRGERD